jgi:serine O-acetyltransferase
MDLQHGRLPDPVAEAIRLVLKDQQQLEERLKRLEEASGVPAIPNELDGERKIIEKEFSEGEGI